MRGSGVHVTVYPRDALPLLDLGIDGHRVGSVPRSEVLMGLGENIASHLGIVGPRVGSVPKSEVRHLGIVGPRVRSVPKSDVRQLGIVGPRVGSVPLGHHSNVIGLSVCCRWRKIATSRDLGS